MRTANELTTRRIDEARDEEVPRSEVLIDKRPTGKFVSGAVLEAAVQYEDFYVLFMTDDVPYEELLTILFLDNQLNLLDSAHIGGAYSTGTFSAMRLDDPNTIYFRFIGESIWSVELLTRPQFCIPFISEPSGVGRSFGFSRHFIVHRDPPPQTV